MIQFLELAQQKNKFDGHQDEGLLRIFDYNKYGDSSSRVVQQNWNTLAVGYEDASIKIWNLITLGKNKKDDRQGILSQT